MFFYHYSPSPQEYTECLALKRLKFESETRPLINPFTQLFLPCILHLKSGGFLALGQSVRGVRMKLFVGNLPFTITEDELRDAFVSVGDVASAKIVVDRMTGKSRGFGFVEMPNDEQARTAISQLHDRELKGRKLVVNEARPKDA